MSRGQVTSGLDKRLGPKKPRCECCGLSPGSCPTVRRKASLARYHSSPSLRARQNEYQKTPAMVAIKRRSRHQLRNKNPAKALWKNAAYRAKRKGIVFTIAISDITVPEVCPCCGKKMEFQTIRLRKNSPALDRIINDHDYTPGNVWVICCRCNMIKNDASILELRCIADAVEKQLHGQ